MEVYEARHPVVHGVDVLSLLQIAHSRVDHLQTLGQRIVVVPSAVVVYNLLMPQTISTHTYIRLNDDLVSSARPLIGEGGM